MGLLARAYRNREATGLGASLILGVPILVVPVIGTLALLEGEIDDVGFWILQMAKFWGLGLLSYLLYPLGREFYFRITGGKRKTRAAFLWLPALAVAGVIRFVLYVLLLVLSVPLGIIGLLYLGTRPSATKTSQDVPV